MEIRAMRNEPKKMLPELGNEWELTRVESGWQRERDRRC